MTPVASVIIPAHDEASVIGRCLARLLDGAAPGELEVIVAANGCTDATVSMARTAAPDATVLDLDVASKVAALNAGDEAATAFPRVYLDADVEVTAADVHRVVAAMDGTGLECTAPRMELALDDRPWYVRSFFRAFLDLPYAADGLVGNGIYVLSAEGRSRFDRFPDITADDLFVRNLFGPHERATVEEATFRVHPPRNLRGLLAIRERTYRGNREYDESGYQSVAEETLQRRRLIDLIRRRPLDAAVYLGVNVLAKVRLKLRRTEVRWERDESARR